MEPVELLIALDLQAALGAMATANGYHYDVVAAAVKFDPEQDVDAVVSPDGPRPLVLIEMAFDEEQWEYTGANHIELTVPAVIHWIGESDPTVDEDWLRVFLRGCADIERAITVDLSRGGLASDTRIVRRSPFRKGAQVTAIVDVEMLVCRGYGQPNA